MSPSRIQTTLKGGTDGRNAVNSKDEVACKVGSYSSLR